jgi:hypothetical protein
VSRVPRVPRVSCLSVGWCLVAVFYCTLCKLSCNNIKPFVSHLEGTRHRLARFYATEAEVLNPPSPRHDTHLDYYLLPLG